MTLKTLQRFDLTPGVSGIREGNGPPLLLIHGVGLCAEAWHPMWPHLVPNFTVTAVDLPGHGNSAGFENISPTLRDYSNRLKVLLDIVNGPTLIVGHSMGALLALDMAIRFPEKVSGVVPLNCVFKRSKEAADAVQARASSLSEIGINDPQPTLERWFGDQPSAALKYHAEDCRNWLNSVDPKGYKNAYRVFAFEDGPCEKELSKLACPALFITGSKEPNSTAQMSQTMAGITPRGQYEIIGDARHMMPMTHGEEVSRLITAFYKQKVPGRG